MEKIKILGVLEEGNGSRFHRVKVILDGLIDDFTVNYVTFPFREVVLTEEHFKNYNVIVSSWIITNPVWEINKWCSIYNCKWIQDQDDNIPQSNHPYYKDEKSREYCKKWIQQMALTCGALTVATEVIKKGLSELRSDIMVSENFLPESGQFSLENKNWDRERKLCVGIASSYSHLADFEELRGVLKKIGNDAELQKKIKFVIYADETKKEWQKVIKLFEGKIEMEVKPFYGVEEYMKIYETLDVILCPLLNTSFNKAKSSLKISEASRKGTIVIGSELYREKELTGLIVAKKPTDYYTTLKWLVKDNNFNETSEKLATINREENDWNKRVNNYKMLVNRVIGKKELKASNCHLFGITYKPEQTTEYTPYFNHRRTPEEGSLNMEHSCIIDIFEKHPEIGENDMVGIFSWKIPTKTQLSSKMLNLYLASINKEYDVLNLTPYYSDLHNNFLNWSFSYHPGLEYLLKDVCKDLGLDSSEVKDTIFANQFVCKASIYREFVNTVTKPAIKLLDTKYKEEGLQNAHYTASGLTEEQMMKSFGMNFFPLRIFLLERLFPIFLNNHPEIKVKNLYAQK